jgi:hypothetical protein
VESGEAAAMKAGAVKAAEAASRASGSGEQDHRERHGAGDRVKHGLADGDPNHVGDMGPGCAGRQSPQIAGLRAWP